MLAVWPPMDSLDLWFIIYRSHGRQNLQTMSYIRRKEKHTVIALIAAKGNSERVPEKNTRPFADTNLLQLKIEQLKESEAFDEIVVSSESEKILGIAVGCGATPWERNPSLSRPETPMSEVYEALADRIRAAYGNVPLAWVQCNNPLVDAEYYGRAAVAYRHMTSAYDCLLSVHRVHEYLINDGQPANFERSPWSRSQDLPPLYAMNFAICILRAKDMVDWQSLVGERPFLFEIPRADAIDIDWPEDFAYCEAEYKRRKGL
jgi:N-acylneuraminate cytidylyltransferase